MAKKKSICPEALAFQPDSVAVAEGQPPKQARIAVYLILFILAFAGAWAWLAELDRVVTAKGMLVTKAGVIVVQPLETSIIRKIAVRPGDVVKKGQLLATLDPTFASADLGQMAERKRYLTSWTGRLEAELTGKEYKGEIAGANPEEQAQIELFARRKEEYRAKIAAQDYEIAGAEQSISANDAEIKRLDGQFKLATEIEAMYRKLFEKASTSRLEYLNALREKLRVEDLYAKANERREQLQDKLSQAKAQKLAFVSNWQTTAAGQLLEARQQLTEVEHNLSKAARRSELVELTAVADAIVKEVAPFSEGSVARQAETLVTLIPIDAEGGTLEAEASIAAADIAHIRAGNLARLKLAAFPFQRYGFLNAEVSMVSPDAFVNDSSSKAQSDGQVNYKVRLKLLSAKLHGTGPDFRLLPGMTLEAEILVGKRRVASYLLEPIIKTLHESLSEP